ncbi:MAG: hypothetical protein PHY16_17890, partial [Methylobacter sp.]|nr:hypothetical protein [Methylobacter sp.]
NSAVKPLSADDSVAGCHAKVGNCQALNTRPSLTAWAFFCPLRAKLRPRRPSDQHLYVLLILQYVSQTI